MTRQGGGLLLPLLRGRSHRRRPHPLRPRLHRRPHTRPSPPSPPPSRLVLSVLSAPSCTPCHPTRRPRGRTLKHVRAPLRCLLLSAASRLFKRHAQFKEGPFEVLHPIKPAYPSPASLPVAAAPSRAHRGLEAACLQDGQVHEPGQVPSAVTSTLVQGPHRGRIRDKWIVHTHKGCRDGAGWAAVVGSVSFGPCQTRVQIPVQPLTS